MGILRTHEFRRHVLPGTQFTTLATPSQGCAEVRVWMVEIAPGTAPVPHRLTAPEVFVVQAGSAQVTIGSDVAQASAGDVIVVPADQEFALEIRGDEPFRAIVAFPLDGKAVVAGGDSFTPPWGA